MRSPGPEENENNETARIHHVARRHCGVPARGTAHKNPDGFIALGVCTPVHAMRRITSRCSTNCDASASSKAKISWPMRPVTACLSKQNAVSMRPIW